MSPFGISYNYTTDADQYYHARARQLALNHIRKQCEQKGLPYAEDLVRVEDILEGDGQSGTKVFTYTGNRQ